MKILVFGKKTLYGAAALFVKGCKSIFSLIDTCLYQKKPSNRIADVAQKTGRIAATLISIPLHLLAMPRTLYLYCKHYNLFFFVFADNKVDRIQIRNVFGIDIEAFHYSTSIVTCLTTLISAFWISVYSIMNFRDEMTPEVVADLLLLRNSYCPFTFGAASVFLIMGLYDETAGAFNTNNRLMWYNLYNLLIFPLESYLDPTATDAFGNTLVHRALHSANLNANNIPKIKKLISTTTLRAANTQYDHSDDPTSTLPFHCNPIPNHIESAVLPFDLALTTNAKLAKEILATVEKTGEKRFKRQHSLSERIQNAFDDSLGIHYFPKVLSFLVASFLVPPMNTISQITQTKEGKETIINRLNTLRKEASKKDFQVVAYAYQLDRQTSIECEAVDTPLADVSNPPRACLTSPFP